MSIKRKKFNVSLLGESEVGKTRISNTYLGKDLDEYTLSTIGIESYMDTATFDGIDYKFKIYDTAGQERYRSISKSTIKITDGFLIVFSVANKKSFELINYWYESIQEVIDIKKKVLILIGNKIDLPDREVSNEEALEYAKAKNMKYFETSAKTGFGIKEAFKELYQDIYELFKKSKEKSNNIELEKNPKKKSRC